MQKPAGHDNWKSIAGKQTAHVTNKILFGNLYSGKSIKKINNKFKQ